MALWSPVGRSASEGSTMSRQGEEDGDWRREGMGNDRCNKVNETRAFPALRSSSSTRVARHESIAVEQTSSVSVVNI